LGYSPTWFTGDYEFIHGNAWLHQRKFHGMGEWDALFYTDKKNMQHFSSQFSICLASWLHPWDTNGDAIQTAHWFGRRHDEKGWAALGLGRFLPMKALHGRISDSVQYVLSLFCWVFNPIYSRGGFMGVSENRIQKAI
jgi:hypothetical protein